ncbi:MAG: stage III sporulation AC/AD family protein [Oscillospiraceae bacterium]|nr:stage III sporulation AC/AD family protein [Oscillospiraceae bacterium]
MVDKRERDMSMLLSVAACCAGAACAANCLKPVVHLLWQLATLGNLHAGMLTVLMKAVGVGFVTEVSAAVCTDAGNSSLGQITRFFGCAAILYVSVPALETFIHLLQEILCVP